MRPLSILGNTACAVGLIISHSGARHKMIELTCKNAENYPEKEFVCEAKSYVKNTKRNKNNYLIIKGLIKALVSLPVLQ